MAQQEKKKITEVKAHARYIHASPQKLRLLANLIRRTPVDTALEQLRFSSKSAALPLAKAINSAIANAVHNFELKKEDLFVKAITIDGGPVFKRYAPRAQGRAFIERKRTSHISVTLEPRVRKSTPKRSIFNLAPKFTKTEPEKSKAVNQLPEEGKVEDKKVIPKQAPKSDQKIKQNLVALKRRLFNRKSGG